MEWSYTLILPQPDFGRESQRLASDRATRKYCQDTSQSRVPSFDGTPVVVCTLATRATVTPAVALSSSLYWLETARPSWHYRVVELYYRVLLRHASIVEFSLANASELTTFQVDHQWLEYRFLGKNSESWRFVHCVHHAADKLPLLGYLCSFPDRGAQFQKPLLSLPKWPGDSRKNVWQFLLAPFSLLRPMPPMRRNAR